MHPTLLKLDDAYASGKGDTNVVIALGEGGKAFCAGGDVVAILKSAASDDKSLSHSFFAEEYALNAAIHRLRVPYVAVLDGITMGGGVGISVHGRFRVATEKTMFAMPESAIGFFCDVGGSYFLPRLQTPLSKSLGFYLGLTGERLRGADVFHAGVATHFVPAQKVPELIEKLCSEAAPDDQGASVQKVLDAFHENDLPEPSVDIQTGRLIEEHFSPSLSVKETFAALQTTYAQDAATVGSLEWAEKMLKKLNSVSPTSLVVIHEQLKRGLACHSLEEALQMEYRIARAYMADTKSDFFEGVRALLVDKDNAPKWNPPSIDQVDEAKVIQKYFATLGDDELVLNQAKSKL
eukprot:CAMPEP_0201549798 /NCGR_PEP_ID=MMETSP0173_2-20130828/6237_1 /ASSEMBLY_ACC=CAM_ASM_000268 /TAXON_ID=218659 /ORGANISM="Vexillifera sp., Strain DIVA3 564/2" /LENGTH=349 /DNA_ID=CAMNT_0047959597 /DNA_START=189 /DNA_END=1238 /DNA_ORIENTATION=-